MGPDSPSGRRRRTAWRRSHWRHVWLATVAMVGAAPAQSSRPASTSRPAPSEARSDAASALLDSAIARLREGYRAEGEERRKAGLDALKTLRQVIADYADTKSAPPARFNGALALDDLLGKPEDAISELRLLIGSDADDRDETGEIMRPFRNYRFHAWRVIADCEVERGDLARAIAACCRARTAYVTHCGTCQAGMEHGNLEHLQSLVAKLAPKMEASAVAALHAKLTSPEALLLHLARALEDGAQAQAMLRTLVAEFPDTAEAKEAREALTAPTSRKK